MANHLRIASEFALTERAMVYDGDCRELLRAIPNGAIRLIVTSPPYNIGKEYERQLDLDHYVAEQSDIIKECVRVLSDRGSICWQVGNYVEDGAIIPLDSLLFPVFQRLGLRMRNRIIWHFEHGLN